MEEFHPRNDEMIFNTEEAHNIIKDCIEGILGKADYNHDSVNKWTAAIVEQSLTHLVKLGKTYKYIVTCAVMQKCGAGLHTASSCFWDTTTDGTCTVRWENRTMNCVNAEYLRNQMIRHIYLFPEAVKDNLEVNTFYESWEHNRFLFASWSK